MAHLLYDTTNGVPEYFKDRKGNFYKFLFNLYNLYFLKK